MRKDLIIGGAGKAFARNRARVLLAGRTREGFDEVGSAS
jgi:hypothetical protein